MSHSTSKFRWYTTISARLQDDDGSETLALTIEAIPVGATLSSFMYSQHHMEFKQLNAPFNGTINLQVKATATERSNGGTASTTETLSVVQ